MRAKLARLLGEFSFAPLSAVYGEVPDQNVRTPMATTSSTRIGFLHHERLAVAHADQVAVEARDRRQPLADLRFSGKQAAALGAAPYCER